MHLHMIGNAHLDPVWLWPWTAGLDEALATFRSAADRCEEYPEFIYTRGEAWLYEQVERLDPRLFGRVRNLVARGQWHVTGGQYIQPDLNAPTAAAMRKQYEYGLAYFERAFGVRPTCAYNVDPVGHPACLPDILASAGMKYYVFRRPLPQEHRLPSTPFIWCGQDGAEIIAYRLPDSYGGNEVPDKRVRTVLQDPCDAFDHAMVFYGVGNHGGGPTKAQIEWISQNLSLEGHEVFFSTPERFFAAVEDHRDSLPRIHGDIQSCYPGCYSVMQPLKQAQRNAALALEQIETHLAAASGTGVTEREQIERAWKDLLFCDFHDIVTGTAAPPAWPSVTAMQGRATIIAAELTAYATRKKAIAELEPRNVHRLVALNLDQTPFDDLLEIEPWLDFDLWRDRWISDEDGNSVEHQLVQPASAVGSRLLIPVTLAPEEMRSFEIHSETPRTAKPSHSAMLAVSERKLCNSQLEVTLDDGRIEQIHYRGKALLAEPGLRLVLRRDTSDTWTSDRDTYDEPLTDSLSGGKWSIEERGPLRGSLRYEGSIGRSPVRMLVRLPRDRDRIELRIEINNQEKFRLLQLGWAGLADIGEATDGLAQGSIHRPCDGREQPFHGWSQFAVQGVAITTTTQDAYSVARAGKRSHITLQRSPLMAWGGNLSPEDLGRRYYTDQGPATFAIDLHFDSQCSPLEAARRARRMVLLPQQCDFYLGMNRPLVSPRPEDEPGAAARFFGREDINDALWAVGDEPIEEETGSPGKGGVL